MAERSKAPDSRLISFPAHRGSGRSGPRMEAWVLLFFVLLDYLPFIT